MNIFAFQRIWASPPTFLFERAAAQSHFSSLCALFDQPKPTDDPTADFTFEHPVRESKGVKGFVDAWKRGAFEWECAAAKPARAIKHEAR